MVVAESYPQLIVQSLLDHMTFFLFKTTSKAAVASIPSKNATFKKTQRFMNIQNTICLDMYKFVYFFLQLKHVHKLI